MTILLILASLTTLWATIVTIMLVRNPLPIPDRGHRAYGLAAESDRAIVAQLLNEIGGLKPRFTFQSGPTRQTLMWDGYTVLNYVDPRQTGTAHLPANAISLATRDPIKAAAKVAELLNKNHRSCEIKEILGNDLPSNHLIVIQSEAFTDWVLVLRRHVMRMPRITKQKIVITD